MVPSNIIRKTEVSVIIPVYNVERFLQDCIDSLLNQSFSDIEFIFVNDASTDSSLSILEKNKKIHPDKIKVIDSSVNLKQGGARNIGIKAASGRFIGFVDSDDLVSPNMFEKLHEAITQSDADVAYIQYSSVPENISLDEAIANRCSYAPLITWDSIIDIDGEVLSETDKTRLLATPIGGVYCGLWRRDILINHNIMFPENLKYEDNYWISLARCYINKIKFVQEVHYFYRKNSNSTTNSINNTHHFDRRKVELLLIDELKRRDLFTRFSDVWEYTFITRYVINSFFLCCSKIKPIPYQFIEQLANDLEHFYPRWKRNKIYISRTSRIQRLKNRLLVRFPTFCASYIARGKQ